MESSHGTDWSFSPHPHTSICVLPRLHVWHLALTTFGAIALLVAIVITITGMVVSCRRKPVSRCLHRLYIGLTVGTCILTLNGLAWWIVFGVVASNPPNGDFCNPKWQNSRDRAVIQAFSISTAALIFTSAAVIWLGIYPKYAKKTAHSTDGHGEWGKLESQQ